MVQSPSSEANWFSAGQEILRILRSPKVHYLTYKCPTLVLILNHLNPVRVTPPPKPNPLGPELVKKFTTFYSTRNYTALFTWSYRSSLSVATCLRSRPSHSSSLSSISIFSCHFCPALPNTLLPLCG
jgi:hypothetical protein